MSLVRYHRISHKACFHSLGFVEWFGASDDPWR